MIAQRVVSVKHADKIIVLDDGKIAAMGTHDELIRSNHVYKNLINMNNSR